jgi:hypothetical protein
MEEDLLTTFVESSGGSIARELIAARDLLTARLKAKSL